MSGNKQSSLLIISGSAIGIGVSVNLHLSARLFFAIASVCQKKTLFKFVFYNNIKGEITDYLKDHSESNYFNFMHHGMDIPDSSLLVRSLSSPMSFLTQSQELLLPSRSSEYIYMLHINLVVSRTVLIYTLSTINK